MDSSGVQYWLCALANLLQNTDEEKKRKSEKREKSRIINSYDTPS